MPDNESRVKTWARVPDGATLTLSVTGTTKDEFVLGTVDALSSENVKTLKQLNTEKGTPFSMSIGKGMQYSVDILLLFQTAATATVSAEITKNGVRHGKPFNPSPVRGRKDAEEFFSLVILAERG
jgi:hypothetical protein